MLGCVHFLNSPFNLSKSIWDFCPSIVLIEFSLPEQPWHKWCAYVRVISFKWNLLQIHVAPLYSAFGLWKKNQSVIICAWSKNATRRLSQGHICRFHSSFFSILLFAFFFRYFASSSSHQWLKTANCSPEEHTIQKDLCMYLCMCIHMYVCITISLVGGEMSSKSNRNQMYHDRQLRHPLRCF